MRRHGGAAAAYQSKAAILTVLTACRSCRVKEGMLAVLCGRCRCCTFNRAAAAAAAAQQRQR